jgi:hypothetical protein
VPLEFEMLAYHSNHSYGGNELIGGGARTHKKPDIGNWKSWGQFQNKKDVRWTGWVDQGGTRAALEFKNLQIDWEGKIVGGGSDAKGQYRLDGKISDTLEVEFRKIYTDQRKISDVTYSGIYSGRQISGTWAVGSDRGKFCAKLGLEKWQGNYQEAGIQKDFIDLGLEIDTDGVFGMGTDSCGTWLIRGDWDQSGGKIKYVQLYLDGNEKNYFYGNAEKGSGLFMVMGSWINNVGIIEGNFALTRKLKAGSFVSSAHELNGLPSGHKKPPKGAMRIGTTERPTINILDNEHSSGGDGVDSNGDKPRKATYFFIVQNF